MHKVLTLHCLRCVEQKLVPVSAPECSVAYGPGRVNFSRVIDHAMGWAAGLWAHHAVGAAGRLWFVKGCRLALKRMFYCPSPVSKVRQ